MATLKQCIQNDDDLLRRVENDQATDLNEYDQDVFEVEYREVNANIRHSEDIRNRTIGFWVQSSGFLFAASGLIVFSHVDPKLRGILLFGVASFGLVATILFSQMESRAMAYFREFAERARALEARRNVCGQWWRTYAHLIRERPADVKVQRGASQVVIMQRFYKAAMGLWFLVAAAGLIWVVVAMRR